jgi:hypothetical protein
MQRPGPPGWGLAVRLTALLCKSIMVVKSKEVKTGWSNSQQSWQNLLRKAMAQKEQSGNNEDELKGIMAKWEGSIFSYPSVCINM